MLNQRGMSHTDSLVFSLSEVATINVQIQKKVTTLLVINLYVTSTVWNLCTVACAQEGVALLQFKNLHFWSNVCNLFHFL